MFSAADPIVIAAYARTPLGGFQGALSSMKVTALGAAAVRAVLSSVDGPRFARVKLD